MIPFQVVPRGKNPKENFVKESEGIVQEEDRKQFLKALDIIP
jgi:hypothetical protein